MRFSRKKTRAEKQAAARNYANWVEQNIAEFPCDQQPAIRRVADQFTSASAKTALFQFLSTANKYHKLAQAMKVIEQSLNEWRYQAPEMRADPYENL